MTAPDVTASAQLGTVGRHASRRVPTAAPDDTAGHVVDGLRGGVFDSAAVVAVLADGRLLGLVTLERLLAAPADAEVHHLMDADPPTVSSTDVQEQAAWLAVQHGEPTLAVVDDGRFMGLVPATALLGVLLAEHDEDLVRMGGFLKTASPAQTTTVEPVLQRLWHRLPWLVVGLVGALLAAGVVGSFEAVLAEHVLIAFFVPGVVYLADAIGTQTEALVIRGLSLGVGIRQVAGREIVTGILLGLVLGAVSLVLVGALWQDWSVALAVALALLAAASIATVIALALPWCIDRAGRDPAFGSGPLATVLQDIITVAIYLAVASVLVV
ncbi:CBS domain-containing protein [Dietzia cinnamea P4]|nr:CBS domain-containing protein [Dietzia cinnamea P4]OAH57127.1 magnesium transporter MgtE [Dietzia cinnamea]